MNNAATMFFGGSVVFISFDIIAPAVFKTLRVHY